MIYKTHYYICISAVIGDATGAYARPNHMRSDAKNIRTVKPTFSASTAIAGLPTTVYQSATVRNAVPSMQHTERKFATTKSITMQHSQKSVSNTWKIMLPI
jgi:hypothetical protein